MTLALATCLRLVFVVVIAPAYQGIGGDTGWYLQNGLQLVTNTLDYPIQPGPAFLLYAGVAQMIAPPGVVVPYLQLLNIGWHAALIAAVYRLGLRYFGVGAARLSALVLAINPIFIIETSAVLTESLFLALIFVALADYAAQHAPPESPTLRGMMGLGVLLGVATLTRAVLLLFPLALVVHLIWQHGWRRGRALAGALALAYLLTVSTWTVFNLARWDRFIIAGEGFTAFAFMGATGITGQADVDAQLGDAAIQNQREGAFVQGILNRLRDLPAYLRTRASNLIESLIQPHNTVYYPGESLKDLALTWWREGRRLDGLARVAAGDAFWSKLVVYGFHGATLVGGVIGLVAHRRRLKALWPLYAYVGYVVAVHSVLFATPRYLLPIQPIFILCGAALLAHLRLARPRWSTPPAPR